MRDSFRGVWTALISPFKDGELDVESFKKILEDQKAAGISGVVPCGTTGETPTLSTDEKKTLIRLAIETMKGSDTGVMAGTGSNNTAQTIEMSKWAAEAGADAVLVVTPYYNKPSQRGLFEHYKAVAESVDCGVVLYNVPGRTSVSLKADTVVELAKISNVVAIKEATADMSFASSIVRGLQKAGQKLELLSGDDLSFLPFLSTGGCGAVSVASNIIPRSMVEMYRSFVQGEIKKATLIHNKYFKLFQSLFIDSNPVPIKYAMARAGFGSEELRLPLVGLSEDAKNLVGQELNSVDLRENGGTK